MNQFFQTLYIPFITSNTLCLKEGLEEILKIDDKRVEKKNKRYRDSLKRLRKILAINNEIVDKQSKLYVASLKGQTQYVQLLLTQGAYVNYTNNSHNNTALHAASGKGHAAVMQLLLAKGWDVNKANKIGWTALHFAVSTIKEETLKIFRLQQSENNHSAAETDQTFNSEYFEKKIEPLEVLLKHGGNVNFQNNKGDTPLHTAIFSCHIEAVTLLLQHGAEVNIKNKEGFTPLDFARAFGEKEMLQLLLLYQKQDKEGNTCLHQSLRDNNLEYAASLIRCGMDLHTTNNQGHSPLRVLSDQLPKYFAQQPTEKTAEEKRDLAGLSCK